MSALDFNTAGISAGVLLISGSGDGDTGGGLCAFDGGQLQTIDRISTAGITLFERRLARLLRTPITTGGGEILVYDERGVSHYLRVDEISDGHYMAWDGNCLIVSSTGNNSLLWINLAGEVVGRWRAPGADDSWHINDVRLVDGRLYACAFGRYSHYRDYKDRISQGDGFIFDVTSGNTIVNGLCAPHSPRYFDDAWTVCDSLRNSVVQADTQGHKKKEAKLRSFTRGMAITNSYVIVGESAARTDGGLETGSIAVLRRSDFSLVSRVAVPFREVSEIEIVPRHFLHSVNTGFRTNPLRLSESDQLRMFRDVGIEPRRLWAVSEPLAAGQCRIRINALIPESLAAGRLTLIACTIQNLSDAFLCSELPYPVHLSYRWKDTSGSSAIAGEENRTRLPRMLAPGSSIQCGLEVLAPKIGGEFEISITLVQEGVTWFDDIAPSNACSARIRVVADSIDLVLDTDQQ